MVWFWYFLIYSFLGFLVEVAYVRLVGGVKRDRKCRLVLPICPVYGLGALAILLLPPLVRDSLPLLFPAAALVCTAVEYVTGLFYEKVFRVSFWDYSHLPLNLGGRVCLLFALFWGVLALLVLHVIHPAAAWLAARIPLWAFPPAVLATALDTLLTARLLRRTGDPNSLRWYARLPRPALCRPAEFTEGLVDLLLRYVCLGHRQNLLQGDGAGRSQHGVLHQHGETALKHRPGPRVVQQLPHRDLIALQVHWLHLPAILCRAGGRFDLPPPGTGAIMIDITVERERNQQT